MPNMLAYGALLLWPVLTVILFNKLPVGRWVEISVRFQGGGGFAVTSLPPNGLEDRPDFPIRRLPGVAPGTLLARMRAEKPEGMPESISVDRAAEQCQQQKRRVQHERLLKASEGNLPLDFPGRKRRGR